MRMGSNFKQDLDDDALSRLPEWCSYEGDDPSLTHLIGLVLPTKDVQRLVYVGERENIWVEQPSGLRERPWLNVWITEYDAEGKVVTTGYGEGEGGPLPVYGPNAMSRADLSAMGFTDSELADLVKEVLGEVYKPDRSGPSDVRRDFFDRAMAKSFG